MRIFPNSFRAALSVVAVLAAFPAASLAQPSGGPYGPLLQTYEVPVNVRTVIYVAPNGDADAAGSRLDAPTTLEAAMSRASTGDAIILRGGEYRTGSIVFNQGITLQPYRDEQPVLKGTEIARDWEKLGHGLWRTKWDRLFPAEPADWWRGPATGSTTTWCSSMAASSNPQGGRAMWTMTPTTSTTRTATST